jgi:hypothetical protein
LNTGFFHAGLSRNSHLSTSFRFQAYNIRQLTMPKPDFGSVTWSHCIFRFFETFYEHVPWNKLCVSTNFIILDLRIKSYGETKNLGEMWASARANQQELTTSIKNCGQQE